MKTSFHKLNITPKPGLMGGYGGTRTATNTRDLLYERVLLIGKQIIISLDLVGIDIDFVESVRTYYPNYNIDIMCTHTHAGPAGTINTYENLNYMQYVFQDINESYLLFLRETICTSIDYVIENQKESTIQLGKTQISDFCSNRHNPSLPFDDSLLLYEIKQENGKLIAMIRLACHPTYLNYENTLYSKDILGEIELELLKTFDEVIFIQGASAEVSTRYTRRKGSMPDLGKIGAKQVLKAHDNTQEISALYIRKEIEINLKSKKDEDIQFNIVFLYLGVPLILIPFEISKDIQFNLFDNLGAYVISIANGYLAYMSETEYYNENKYESEMSMLKQGEAEKMVETIIKEMSIHGQ